VIVMISFFLSTLCLLQAPVTDELQGTVKSEPYDVEIGLPKGWTTTRAAGSTFFRAKAPEGGLPQGETWLEYRESSQPVTLAFIVETFSKRAPSSPDYPGFKALGERDVQAAGFPAKQLIFSATGKGKDVVIVRAIIQRQLLEYFVLDVVAAASERERAVALSDRMLASFRTGLPAPRERDEKVRRTWAAVKASPARPGLAGTTWHELFVGDKKFGRQKVVLREATVDGAPGWEFEIESLQEDGDGGSRSDVSKGSFTVDGSVQRVELHRIVKTPKDPEVNVKESVSLVRGTVRTVRHFLDQKVEKEFAAPDATYLADVAETIRRYVALLPAGSNAIRILEPFKDIAVVEEWEHAAAAKMKVDGTERDVIQGVVTGGRRDTAEYLFDPDGSLRRRKGAAGLLVLKRCTEEQALK
jgi:hypothetical protein